MGTLLQVNHLHVAIGDSALCRDLNLEISPAQCWAVLGANGSGKTTLLHTLAGLRDLQAGEIRLQGEPMYSLGRREVARRIGILLQDSVDIFPASVWETVLTGRHPHLGRWGSENAWDKAIAHKALARMELSGLEQRLANALSGGERRRLAIATLLTQQPPLMLLDEPANHLDLRHQISTLGHIRQLCNEGQAAMMVLHDVNQAVRYCDHVLLLFGNGEWEAGPAEELLDENRLTRLYGYPLRRHIAGDEVVFLPAN